MVSARRPLLAALAAAATLLGAASPADAGLFSRKPKPPVETRISTQPLNTPIAETPDNPRGTVILVHAGGWSGPDRSHQQAILDDIGPVFSDRRYRTVSIDYLPGRAGLQSVEDAVGEELVRRPKGPLCLYGESSGGHLALLAAAAIPSVDCVMVNGAPSDFAAWQRDIESGVAGTTSASTFASLVPFFFGAVGTPDNTTFDPAPVLGYIAGDVFAVLGQDDGLVPVSQLDAILHAVPTAVALRPEAGSHRYLHGTLSDEGVRQLHEGLGDFIDRVALRKKHELALKASTGCPDLGKNAALVTSKRFAAATACALNRTVRRRDTHLRASGASLHRAQTIRLKLGPGKVTPARAATALARDPRAARLLRRRSLRQMTIRFGLGSDSVIVLRVR